MSKKKTNLFLPTSYISNSDLLDDLLQNDQGLDVKDGFKPEKPESPMTSPKPGLGSKESPDFSPKSNKEERKKPVIEKINIKDIL